MTTKKENLFLFSFIILLILNIVCRIVVLQQFSFEFTDSDQVIMWAGAKDFFLGQFHEPAYYGQAYNSMTEALFASVFYNYAAPSLILPIITSLLALLPYAIISILCYFKKLKMQAFIILTLPLLLPPEYDFITSMPRGFVTGIFFTALASLAVYFPEKKWGFFFFSFFNIIGLSLNPNAILITIPCGLFLLFSNYKSKVFYMYSIAGALLASALPVYTWYFYEQHPLYIVHGIGKLEFTRDNFLRGLSMMDKIFEYITPLFWYQTLMTFLILLIPAVVLFLQKEKTKGLILGLLLVLVVATWSVNKIYDADETLFLPYSRMYLALPVTIALFIPFIKINKWKPVLITTGILASYFFVYKLTILQESISAVTEEGKYSILTVARVSDINEHCSGINALCKQYQVNLVLIAENDQADSFINYGCPACEKDLPPTLSPKNERRTWKLLEEKDKIHKTILIFDESQKVKVAAQESGASPVDLLPLENNRFLLRNNSLSTVEVIKRLKIKVKPF